MPIDEHNHHTYLRPRIALEKYIARVEQRRAGLRKINKAKSILMNTRDQAMSKRVTAEEIADAVINANEILGFDLKS